MNSNKSAEELSYISDFTMNSVGFMNKKPEDNKVDDGGQQKSHRKQECSNIDSLNFHLDQTAD